MANFELTVVTPSRVLYDGAVERVIVRTTSGDIGILQGHANYVSPLAIGAMEIAVDGKKKIAAVAGGLVKVSKDKTTILTNSCEWSEEIDVERAKLAAQRANDYIKKPTELHTEEIAEIKLKRALNRIEIAERNGK